MLALLERFYEPEAGAITIGGVDIRDFNIQALRRQIGLVSQEPVCAATLAPCSLRRGVSVALSCCHGRTHAHASARVADVDMHSRMRSYAHQNAQILFATSIRENIAYGREGATTEEVFAAAQAASAYALALEFRLCIAPPPPP